MVLVYMKVFELELVIGECGRCPVLSFVSHIAYEVMMFIIRYYELRIFLEAVFDSFLVECALIVRDSGCAEAR